MFSSSIAQGQQLNSCYKVDEPTVAPDREKKSNKSQTENIVKLLFQRETNPTSTITKKMKLFGLKIHAETLQKQLQYAAAAEVYNKALDLPGGQQDYQIVRNYAITLMMQSQYETAAIYFKKAQAFPEAREDLTIKGYYEEVVLELERRSNPNSQDTYNTEFVFSPSFYM